MQWRHNERDGVPNHQPHDCLLKRLLRRRSKKTSKVRVTGLWVGNSPLTGEFPAQRASNAEMFPFDNVSMIRTMKLCSAWSRFVAHLVCFHFIKWNMEYHFRVTEDDDIWKGKPCQQITFVHGKVSTCTLIWYHYKQRVHKTEYYVDNERRQQCQPLVRVMISHGRLEWWTVVTINAKQIETKNKNKNKTQWACTALYLPFKRCYLW